MFRSPARSISAALLEARAQAAQRPGWAAIFVKAFALVAKEEPVLRTLYAKWPLPAFYELPRSVAMVAIARVEDGEDCVLPQKVAAPDEMTLAEIDALIRHAKEAPIDQVPAFRKILRATRLPLPLRRLVWAIGLNFGRQRANYFGSFGVTSVAAYGAGELHAMSPGPFVLSYGVEKAGPVDRRRAPLGPPDYRCRPDGQGPDPAGTGAEQRNRSRIAGKSAAFRAETGPGGGDLTGRLAASLGRPFSLTERRFLPNNPLARGPFSARVAFRDPWSSPSFWGGPVGTGKFPAHRRARLLKTQTYQEDAMTKRSEAKYKIDRRMGQNIWGRPKSPVNRREYGPGQHGQRRKGKLSDFGVQLRAKQKLKGYYANISERQFHGIYVEAGRMKGDTGENLIGLLERRLDTVVYRAKFVATMFAARQFINHGHIKVNGRRVNISSYKVKPGDLVEIKESSKQLTPVLEASQLGERDVPDFIEADHSKMTAKFIRIPALSDVPFAVQMEPHLIVEFYSR